MKKIILGIILSVVCAYSVNAQDARLMKIQEALDKNNGKFRELVSQKKYAEAVVPMKELILLFDTTTIFKDPSIGIPEGAVKTQKGVLQYDLACCYAKWGKKKLALETLEQSVENGYYDYKNMLNDNDLISLRKDKKYKQLLEIVADRSPHAVLKKSNAYKKQIEGTIPQFMYQPQEHSNLLLVREYFKLDTIPGKDNELEHIKNLLHFAHDNIRHDGSNRANCEFTAIDLYNYCKATGKGVNCRQLALSLCDMYLAMGYKARVVTCMPANPNDYECHVINTVWSETLQKWLYIDPTMDAWVMDENRTMLSIAEVRERLIDGRTLVLCPTANWNHESMQTKEHYLEEYMAKNLYYFICKKKSFFNQESIYRIVDNEDIRLIPEGFVNDNYGSAATTTDPELFWAKPQ